MKNIITLLSVLSFNAFSQEQPENYLLFSNNGLALNGLYSADKAIDFAKTNNLIKYNPYNKIIKYNNVVIDLNSSTNYKVKTEKEVFKYKSDANFGARILDRISNRTIVFDIQPIGDYLLFSEDTKITCFNLKQKRPCLKFVKKPDMDSKGEVGVIKSSMDEVYFYNDRKSNFIFQCASSVNFNKDKDSVKCESKRYINLENLM